MASPRAPSPVVELLRQIGEALASVGVGWYVFGAQAAILHGAARLTADVDITVALGPRPTSELVAALERQRVALRVRDVEGFVERTRVLPMLHEPSGIPVDVVLAGPGLEELFLARAKTVVVDDVAIPVASAEDLVAMKILAGRPRDIEDVDAVLLAQGAAFDLAQARETVRLLEQALDRRDLLPLLEAARARSGRSDRR